MHRDEQSEADARLAALFAVQAAPARDPLFVAATMQRVARRRAWARVAAAAPWAVAAATLLWVSGPMLAPVLEALGEIAARAGAVVGVSLIVGVVALMAARRLSPGGR